MTRRTQHCLDCGDPISVWALRCKPCRDRRKNAVYHCVDCDKPLHHGPAQRCRACAARHIGEQNKQRHTWWHYAPPTSGYAISAPGGGW